MSQQKTSPVFQEGDIGITLKKQLGWTDMNVYPSGVLVDHEIPKSDPRFYDDGVYYVPERIGTVEKYEAARSEELVAIGERCSLCKKQLYGYENYCPECGAKFEFRIEEEVVSE